ncbi:O-antigen polymerase [Streptomyces sp. NBC_01537]|uniref:O-antigen ligase family protein n=1 Tax=Streptomyces sp. NBC_01537 TaxID=2903896 RepID=UPI003869731B
MDTRTGGATGDARGRDVLTDVLGAVVLVCSAGWALIAATGRPARPEGVVLAVLAVAAGYAAGRIGGALLPMAAPALTALAVVALAVALPGRLAGGGGRHTPPLGYANADAALLVLATGAACCAAWSARSRPLRTGLRLLGAVAAVLALVIGSAAGFAASVGVVLCSLAADRTPRLLGLTGLALAAALAAGGTYAVAVDALPAGLSASLTGQLTPGRVAVWREAVDLAGRHPLRGVGPGQFAEVSQGEDGQAEPAVTTAAALSTAATDAAEPRSAPFQLAAEEGAAGVALLAASYAWVLLALHRSARPTPVVLTAGAALTGLAMQACVDHVLSYAAVTATAGLLAGLATARPFADDRDRA